MSEFLIRPIQAQDNEALARIVRNALAEFGANKPGTVYFDPTTDHLFELFQQPGALYWVATTHPSAENIEGTLLGGAGVFPSEGLPEGTCELVKMYLKPESRGLGLGGGLIKKCMEEAKAYGYRNMYLETLPELHQAVKVYEKYGFQYLPGPLGNTGHFGCDLWMLKAL
jgi:putative acetyltransferase